jgi:hypothetical protein
MSKPVFYFTKLNTWDIATMSIYTLLSVALWYVFDSNQGKLLFLYTITTHLFLYYFNYKSLRNLTVYLFWFAFGMIHLYTYFQLKDVEALEGVNAHSATGLRNTVVLLILFQILRMISAYVQGQELVPVSAYGGIDFSDFRRPTIIDFMLFNIYMIATVLLLFFD